MINYSISKLHYANKIEGDAPDTVQPDISFPEKPNT